METRIKLAVLMLTLSTLLTGPATAATNTQEYANVVAQILDRTSEWADALRGRDVSGAMDMFVNSEDLRHTENGVTFASYSALTEFMNEWFASTVRMEFSWKHRDVVPLAENVATMTGVFEYAAEQKSGEVWRGKNVFTAVFVKKEGSWQLIHGHESSVPETTAAGSEG
jgi:ketosteroid isomerase-like protein